MAKNKIHVRFLNNFILTVVQTIVGKDGKMVVKDKQFHIQLGDVYPVEQYQRHPDNKVDIHFPDTCPLAGVAHRIEGDYCELHQPASVKSTVTGCGGCGNKPKKKA